MMTYLISVLTFANDYEKKPFHRIQNINGKIKSNLIKQCFSILPAF